MKKTQEILKIINNYGRPGIVARLNITQNASLDLDNLREQNWNETVIEKLQLFIKSFPNFDFSILNSKLDTNLFKQNLGLKVNSKPIIGEPVFNPHGLALHNAKYLLNEATRFNLDNLSFSGLAFRIVGDTRTIEWGTDLNDLITEYLIVDRMNFQKPHLINPDLRHTQMRVLPCTRTLIDTIDSITNKSLIEMYMAADGPSLALTLMNNLTEEEYVDVMKAFQIINNYNKQYMERDLSKEERDELMEVYYGLEIILMNVFHQSIHR